VGSRASDSATAPLTFTVAASAESPVENLALIVKGLGRAWRHADGGRAVRSIAARTSASVIDRGWRPPT
jgi:hypothetical protein